jgi:bile acid:Na+ symporter, BASS family
VNTKGLLCSTALVMGTTLIISLITNISGYFPYEIFTSSLRKNITLVLIIIMITVSLSRIPYKNLDPIKNSKSLMRALILGLMAASIIPLLAYLVLKDLPDFKDYAPGLIFIAAAPFAVSIPPLSYILRGDLVHALRSTIFVYVFALLWIPLIIWITIGELVDMKNVLITIAEVIGLPLVLSRLLTKVEISKEVMSITLNLILALFVWLSVSTAIFPSTTYVLVVFLLVAAIRTFVFSNGVNAIERKLKVPWPQRVTDVLMVSYKNNGIAIALCVATLGTQAPYAVTVIATSIVIEICWVTFMDSVTFSKRRMEREMAIDKEREII